mmetsp:Transcript_106092/g.277069  ORF Transcript_106092/g.277069 Transcript_106092/m.277069 type:complete len:280 (-) Transcript_106092:1084-1923(-)
MDVLAQHFVECVGRGSDDEVNHQHLQVGLTRSSDVPEYLGAAPVVPIVQDALHDDEVGSYGKDLEEITRRKIDIPRSDYPSLLGLLDNGAKVQQMARAAWARQRDLIEQVASAATQINDIPTVRPLVAIHDAWYRRSHELLHIPAENDFLLWLLGRHVRIEVAVHCDLERGRAARIPHLVDPGQAKQILGRSAPKATQMHCATFPQLQGARRVAKATPFDLLEDLERRHVPQSLVEKRAVRDARARGDVHNCNRLFKANDIRHPLPNESAQDWCSIKLV